MGGRGQPPKPATARRTRHEPIRGDWKASPGLGWRHGPVPAPPDGLGASALAAWKVWMQSWIAPHWEPNDLPGLRITVELYDACERYFEDPYVEKTTPKGDSIFVLRPNPASELRQMMDNYGISPKGQQDRRWTRPVEPTEQPKGKPSAPNGHYGALKVVNE